MTSQEIDKMFVMELGNNAVVVSMISELAEYEMDDDCREELVEIISSLDDGESVCFDKNDPDTYRILGSN